uniref:DUF6824 domain-containing protein n=1 Tax=Odontella aurita TaxID=265563 RepID=A0A7S4HWI4_9STRA|mmetsp:Transcript_16142/g.46565  ORF Transcript_16142/g.46565 Transcript_16142/m.46565 type:complete len:785 (+) Transcript_16142:151-2505(+)
MADVMATVQNVLLPSTGVKEDDKAKQEDQWRASHPVPEEQNIAKNAPSALPENGEDDTSAPLPPDDFDVIVSSERDLLGNFLVRDLIFHHGTRTYDGGGGGISVADIASRIVSTVQNGIGFSVAGDGRYGGGRFLRRVEGGANVATATGPAYHELDADEARAYISGVFQEAFPQHANEKSSVSGAPDEHAKKEVSNQKDVSAEKECHPSDQALSSVRTNDVLLMNGNVSYPSDEVYASHPGNKRFIEFLNGASSGLESSGLDSSPGAATARAQLFIASVDFVRGSASKGRFLTQRVQGGEWGDIDNELAVWETITVLLWRKFLELERQKLLSPAPPPVPVGKVGQVVIQPHAPPAEGMPTSYAQAYSSPRTVSGRESQQYCRWPADYHVIPPSTAPIGRPTDHDVLFGRGGLTNHHPGNKRFRDIIAVHRADYVAAIKIEKPNVARKIVRAIRCGIPAGRFMKKNSKDGMWYDVGDRHAAEKASQALREKSQAEKYEKVALKKQAEAAIRGSKIAKGAAPFGTMAMPPLATGVAPPAIMAGHPVMPYPPPPPPGHAIYGLAPNPGAPPPPAGTGAKSENSSTNKRKASAESAGKSAKKPKSASSEGSSSTEVYTPIDQYGNVVVTDHDILCGRGGLTNHHLGNKRFRDIVSLHRPDYIRAPKIEKPSVARMIVSAIRNGNPPGRFLKKDNVTGKWFDIGDKRAAEKASQALREKTPEERLKLAAKHDRPMPTRQYFSPSGNAEDLQFASAECADATPKEDKEEAVPPTPSSPPKARKREVFVEI